MKRLPFGASAAPVGRPGQAQTIRASRWLATDAMPGDAVPSVVVPTDVAAAEALGDGTGKGEARGEAASAGGGLRRFAARLNRVAARGCKELSNCGRPITAMAPAPLTSSTVRANKALQTTRMFLPSVAVERAPELIQSELHDGR
jgi:hypothetical protein